ncbi:MAG TPA: MaoC family dehydratase N-terminal domain-containing protein [Dehalococcoidia bacterium]|nr:MaoC family dehydratase N-terminal domain-containing protein [Dehalococcoidia bacterium]
MSEQPVSYVNEHMLRAKGVWTDERTSPPIAESDIRKWAIATYWPETPPRLHWDAEYAASTRWGGIIAPPDFNPFAWPIKRPTVDPRATQGEKPDGSALTNMNGGQTDTFGVPMRPGDVVTSRTRLFDWNEREGRLGHTLYTFMETEWRNQDGNVIKRRVSTNIRY